MLVTLADVYQSLLLLLSGIVPLLAFLCAYVGLESSGAE
jgi:hypothetical protein